MPLWRWSVRLRPLPGVRRLLALAFRDRIRDLERDLGKDMALGPLKAEVVVAALERTFLAESLPMRQAQFARRVEEGRSRFTLIAQEIARAARGILAEQAALAKKLNGLEKAFPAAVAEIRACGVEAEAYQCDVGDREAVFAMKTSSPGSKGRHALKYLVGLRGRLSK